MIGKMYLTFGGGGGGGGGGTNLVRSQNFLAMLPNQGLEGTQEWTLLSLLQNEFCSCD